MDTTLALALNALHQDQYPSPALHTFLTAHPPDRLLSFFRATNNPQFKGKVATLLKQTDTPPDYILNFLELMAAKDCKATLLSKDLDLPIFDFLQLMHEGLAQRALHSKDLLLLLLKLLFEEDGLKVFKTVVYVCKNPHNEMIGDEDILAHLKQGLDSKDSVIRMRFMEIVMEAAPNHLLALQSEGLIDRSLQHYHTADVLQKLASAELIILLGGNKETANLLLQHQAWSQIEKDAFDPQSPYYVQKNLIGVMMRMSSCGVIKLDYLLSKRISKFLMTSCTAGPQELSGSLYLISFLFQTNEGIQCFFSQKTVVQRFAQIPRIGTHEELRLFYSCLAALTASDKLPKLVINVLSLCGNPGIIGSFDHKNAINDYGLTAFYEMLFKQLLLPFEDVELLAVITLRNGLRYKRLMEETVAAPRLVDYLVHKNATHIEIYQLKEQIQQEVSAADDGAKSTLEKALKEKGNEAKMALKGA